MANPRCVNIDWLEVHCLESSDSPRDADFFRSFGFVVHERDYGTRVYRQMFTLEGTDGLPFIEIRRDPASAGVLGIHDSHECHLRLTNRTCYFDNAAALMRDFLNKYDYTFNRITRVDICMDFTHFDLGDDPQAFVRRYFRHKYAKINQGNIHGHGSDTWSGQEWNSLAWGSPTSDIGTKMYNKTLELYDRSTSSYRKPYIREAWLRCGLIDDLHGCTCNGETVNVWRVEFSIRSSVKKWFVMELDGRSKNYQSIRNTLDMYDGRDKLVTMFASLSQHYFRFKYYEDGVRKDRCRDKILFRWNGQQITYKIGRDSTCLGEGKSLVRPLDSLAKKLRQFRETHTQREVQLAVSTLLDVIEEDNLRSELANPWSREELEILRAAVSQKQRNPSLDVAVVLREIREFLRINDKTLPF